MAEQEKWGVLYCPKTGSMHPQKRWEQVERCLHAEGIEFDHVQSESRGSVERLVKMLVNNGYKTIVVVGGDSALNDAVNCLMQIDSKERGEIALGVIPNGTMNDFARFWNITESDMETTVKALKRHRVRKVDLGCVRYRNKEGEACRRYFLNCLNIGLVARIMDLRRKTRHYLLGSRTLSFIISFVLLVFQRMEYAMHLKINSDEIRRKVMTVCIGNAHGYGQTPSAVPYNGLLDVSVVYHPALLQLFEGIYLFVRGKYLNHRNVHPYRTKKVDVIDLQHAMVSVDGRVMNTPAGSFTVSVEQEVINFLIP
ncbi:MAG: YegS/Rv2252/BmrU family lipid kinase [Prevotella sp.]|nr:YegS/Rv2252/BmrU family lipid kinase [Prevotella sp.]